VIIVGSRVDGKVESGGGGTLVVRGSVVDGKVTSNGDSYVRITDNTISGKLEVINTAGDCKSSGNTVEGKTNTPNCTP